MSEKEFKEMLDNMSSTEFKNIHGEVFKLYSNGITILMGGDEVNAMVDDKHKTNGVIPLFNSKFNIWSAAELFELGACIQYLAEEKMSREDFEFIDSKTDSSFK